MPARRVPQDTVMLPLPPNLVRAAEEEGRQFWLATLPAAVEAIQERWSLRVQAPFWPGGQTAWVAPVLGPAGSDFVLKLAWRHADSLHEADGLRVWDGQGAVRLYAALDLDRQTTALLLERCRPGTCLSDVAEPDQDVVISGLLERLWRPPPPAHPFRSLALMCQEWADEFEQKMAAGLGTLDHGLARDGIALFRTLPATADREVMLCTDLHADNVLAAGREPWLVIDPKPYVGDPTYDVIQHMLNCQERLGADPAGLARRMARLSGLDPDRLLLWLFARCVQESPDCPELGRIAVAVAPRH